MSTRMFATTMNSAPSSTVPCTIGKSEWVIAV